ncbi:MAG: formate/nitrite transporter family protein [Oscillospiraceae bacterium]|nr:formate/nitrite transporter family protein [Oscillospiraceae bacterium]
MRSILTSSENLENFMQIGETRVRMSALRILILGLMGGMFIAFAGVASSAAVHTLGSAGLARALAGAIFPGGLLMITFAGAELFTGNMLLSIPCLGRRVKFRSAVKNISIAYAGNLAGSVLIAALCWGGGYFMTTGGLMGGYAISVAAQKSAIGFWQGLSSGILANALVCIAVWSAGAVKSAAGKVFCVYFPIAMFVISGFEHSIANMYFIPAGMFAKLSPVCVDQARTLGVTDAMLDNLNFSGFWQNLIPVTIGNMLGGILLVGLTYWLALRNKDKKA